MIGSFFWSKRLRCVSCFYPMSWLVGPQVSVKARNVRSGCVGPCASFNFGLLFNATVGGRLLVDFLGTLLFGRRAIGSIACLGTRRLSARRCSHHTIFSMCYRGRGNRGFLIRVRHNRRRFFGSHDICCTAFPVHRRSRQKG